MAEQTFSAGFAWSMPAAFCDPLGACRFEEGDSLYDTKDGYLQWDEALKRLKYGIQIKAPKKTAKGTLKEDEDAVFARNWSEPVTFELARYQENKREMTFNPHDLKLANADGYAPTVSYVAFATDNGATEKIRDCLKKGLYKPTRNRTTTIDRFQLRRHGFLIPPNI